MASGKELKKRINSVKNTRKITRTMEMVSTAKSKKLVDRVNAAKPYGEKLRQIMASLGDLGSQIDSPYLRQEEQPRRIALVVVTANRGLCGGYNSSVLKLARARYQALKADGREVDVHMLGKKGLAFFKFVKIPVKESYTEFDDAFTYPQAEALVERLMKGFAHGEFDRVEIISTVYYSAGSQKPERNQLLPVGLEEAAQDPHPDQKHALEDTGPAGGGGPVIYDPEPEVIAAKILPLAIKSTFYRLILEAVASEQIYRRIAMKNASDAAADMVRGLTRTYNRMRQATITQEISEIVSGADAL